VLPDLEAISALVERRVLDLRTTLDSEPEAARRAMRRLLGGERLRVYSDPDRGFRVEGILRVPLNDEPPGTEASGRFDCWVAGGRFATGEHLPRELAFPLAA
jgi:hypothetical protein